MESEDKMSGYNIRLSSMLTFDEEKEADIIQVIEKLNSMHKTGNFLSNLIRVSLDCPEILDQSNGKFTKGSTLVDLEQYGLTYNRRALADKNSKEIADMKKKVDSVYDMTLKMYTLVLMNKYMGIEQKTENSMIANFIVQKQLEELKKSLGVSLSDNIFASNKVKDTKQLAENSLEFILNTYDDIISEVKSKISKDNSDLINSLISALGNININNNTEVRVLDTEEKNTVVTSTSTSANNTSTPIGEEIIDFGTENLGALGNFFGD